MKKTIFTILVIILSLSTIAFTNASAADRASNDMARKKLSIEDSIAFENACRLLENKTFVIEASRIIMDQGQTILVNASTNFLMLNGEKAVVQIAPLKVGGPNGVGGITLDGIPSAISYRTDKRNNFYMEYNVNGAGISASVNITLPHGSTSPNVHIRAMYNSSDITLFGDLYSPSESTVFEGLSL